MKTTKTSTQRDSRGVWWWLSKELAEEVFQFSRMAQCEPHCAQHITLVVQLISMAAKASKGTLKSKSFERYTPETYTNCPNSKSGLNENETVSISKEMKFEIATDEGGTREGDEPINEKQRTYKSRRR